MRIIVASLLAVMTVLAKPGIGQTPDDKAAIRQAALDYIEGWYEANAVRMDRVSGL